MSDNAQDADAALSRSIEGTKYQTLNRVIQIGVLIDDARRVAAQFKHDFLFAVSRFEIPANAGRTGEAEKFQTVVGREQIGSIARARQYQKRPSGRSVSARTSPMIRAPIGVRLAGWRTNGHPTAMAGATL